MHVYVLITMDMEPVRQRPEWTGPADWSESERYAQAYADLAWEFGFPVSCFAHPETVHVHRDTLMAWQQRGGTVGLHLHPPKYRHPTYTFEFGAYTAAEQRSMLAQARDQWEDGMEMPCRYFRPGAFSANDASFGVLADMGFRGGSLSIPGRVWPRRYCVWSGAPADPHRAHEAFRLVPGRLPFANIPLSVDLNSSRTAPGYRFCLDLRPTLSNPPVREILDRILRALADRRPTVPVLQVVAHNDQPFADPDSQAGRRMRELLAALGPSCRAVGMTPLAGSLADVCDAVLDRPLVPAVSWDAPNDVT